MGKGTTVILVQNSPQPFDSDGNKCLTGGFTIDTKRLWTNLQDKTEQA